MTTEYQRTPEEEAYHRLLEEKWETLSEAARTIPREAHLDAYKFNLCHNYAYEPVDYEEAMKRMRLAAAKLTDRDCESLKKLWLSALAAAASIDPDDFETLVGYRVYPANLHQYHRMFSGMVEELLEEKKTAERQEDIAEREPKDFSDLSF